MKTKILKKILSIIIVASTVIATPGLASAAKSRKTAAERKTSQSEKPGGNSKKDGKKRRKRRNFRRIKKNDFVKNAEIDSKLLKLDSLLQKTSHDENDKKDFLDVVKYLISCDFFKIYSSGNLLYSNDKMLKITDLLLKFFVDNYDRANILQVINKLICKRCLERYSDEDMIKILTTVLEFNDDSEEIQVEVLRLLGLMPYYKKGLKKYFKEHILEIENLLAKCINNPNARGHIVTLIGDLAMANFFRGSSKEEILKMLDLLAICSNCAKLHFEKVNIAIVIEVLTERGLLEECSKDEILKLMGILSKCISVQSAGRYVAKAIENMAFRGLFCEYSPSENWEIVELLFGCGYDQPGRFCVLEAIEEMASAGLFNEFSKEQVMKIVDLLNVRASDSEPVKKLIVSIIRSIVEYGMYFYYDKLRGVCCENEFAKASVLFVSKSSDEKCLFDECCEKEMLEIINILANCAETEATRKTVAEAIFCTIAQSSSNKLSKETIFKMLQILNVCCENDSATVAESIGYLAQRDFLNGYSAEEISQILDLLLKCSEDKDSRPSFAIALFKLAGKNLLDQQSKEKIMKITDLLMMFAGENTYNIHFLRAISALFGRGLLRGYPEEKLQKIRSLLR